MPVVNVWSTLQIQEHPHISKALDPALPTIGIRQDTLEDLLDVEARTRCTGEVNLSELFLHISCNKMRPFDAIASWVITRFRPLSSLRNN